MRDYLDSLARNGEVVTVDRPVDPYHELAAVTRAMQDRGTQVVRFNSVRDTDLPVVTNVHTNRERFAQLIGATRKTFCRDWQTLVREPGSSQAPTAAVARPADLVSGTLGDLPLITYHARDAAPYFTAAIVLAQDPDTAVPNLSFHRAMFVSDAELRVRIGESHDLAAIYAKAEARNEPLDAAMLIGVAPELFAAACASIPRDASELALAARIAGQPLPVYPGDAVALDIPASTEVVIEGQILPGERRREGPFGEFLGYYVPEGRNPVFDVRSVYWRPQAVFHSLLCGSAEDRVPLQMLNAAATFGYLSKRLPGIVDVSCAPSLLNTTVSIEQQYDGHARDVMMAAFESNQDYHKVCVVVDADDSTDDVTEVFRALVSRGRLDKRVIVIEDMPGFYRDPHKDHYGRLGIDATRPYGREAEFEKKAIPGQNDIDLDDWL
ncbi:MAG: UbiD family decarboxylase [Gammaproteobacteria bacterium]|nr:UbiD family decarboxylase [Gammaproteobacteria bacterium]